MDQVVGASVEVPSARTPAEPTCGEWETARHEFHTRRATALHRALPRHVPDDDLRALDRVFADRGADVDAVMDRVFRAASRVPSGLVTAALYTMILSREKWESSTDWLRIEAVLVSARRVGTAVAGRADEADDGAGAPGEAGAVSTVLAYADVIERCLWVENALNNSCAADFGDRAARAHRHTLEEMRSLLRRPWLLVRRATIVYCYPFALRHGPETVCERARDLLMRPACSTTPTTPRARWYGWRRSSSPSSPCSWR